MADTLALARDGPYGGNGGSAYDLRDHEHKIKHIDAWEAKWQNYDVIGALRFRFDNGDLSNRVGGRDPNTNYYLKSFDFGDDEGIKEMTVYAGNNEGFLNGFKFRTTHNREWKVGGTEGQPFPVKNLGKKGEWAGATGRDGIHGADAVVDSAILYFKE
ncbi:hypothetical protein ETB97_005988 [Aspergillus alliaceus]|uniref:Jacalin-type lectin domain-containing protein n=1 Tax=Petromyces alliaceus TaxID=209559 RepID=A0A8H5ZXX3_PETAA|nr:hypothetical protein ETB97_005988 [Aspergillus burnettii]